MRVLHLCLSSFFIDNRAYQENELSEEHARQGHTVQVIASTQVHNADGLRDYCEPAEYNTDEGVSVIRLPYHPSLPHRIGRSLRVHKGVYEIIADFKPDVMLFHGMCGWELKTCTAYRRKNPEVLLYVDNHADFVNSARTFISKWFLHFAFYRTIVRTSLPYIEKVLCVSGVTEIFAREFYGISASKLEFYPLGGHPIVGTEYEERRRRIRRDLDIESHQILIVQTGKQFREKRLPEALRYFANVDSDAIRFIIAGVLMDDIRDEVEALIAQDERVSYLGWKNPEELESILCASDVYFQPGRQSSTMQTSICCQCAIVIDNWKGHEFYVNGNGWLLNDPEEMMGILKSIVDGEVNLEKMKENSREFAIANLDYGSLAKRVLVPSSQ